MPEEPCIPVIELSGPRVILQFPGPLGTVPADKIEVPGSLGQWLNAVLATPEDGVAHWIGVQSPITLSDQGLALALGEGIGDLGGKIGLAPKQWARWGAFGGNVAPFTMVRTGTATVSTTTTGIADAAHPLPYDFQTGTGTSDRGTLTLGASDGFVLSSANRFRLTLDARVPVLSDATNSFVFAVGWNETTTAQASTTNGLMLRYSHSINGGNWQLESKRGGVSTTIGAADAVVAATWDTLEVVGQLDGVHLIVNGGDVGSVIPWASVPTAGLGFVAGIFKSAGTTNRSVYAVPVCIDMEANR